MRPRRLRFPAVVACVVSQVALVGSASPAFAVGGSATGIGAAPAPDSTQLAPGGGYFQPKLSPGTSWHAGIVVSNNSSNAAFISIFGADGLTGTTSGAVYSNQGTSLTAAGAWIHVDTPRIFLGASKETRIGFAVDVPNSARPGDHLAAVVVQNAIPASKSSAEFQVNVVARVVTAVLIVVPGSADFSASIGKLTIVKASGDVGQVIVPVTDTGQLLGKPMLTLTLEKSAHYRRTVSQQVNTLLPGGTAHFPVDWPGSLVGLYQARACLTGAGLKSPVCATESVSVGSSTIPYQDSLRRSSPVVVTRSVFPTWAKVALSGLGVALLLMSGVFVVLLRRSRRTTARRGSLPR